MFVSLSSAPVSQPSTDPWEVHNLFTQSLEHDLHKQDHGGIYWVLGGHQCTPVTQEKLGPTAAVALKGTMAEQTRLEVC